MFRINENDLREDEWGVCYYYGKPFTGISYQLYEDGRIFGEAELIDGVIGGHYRQWYPSGGLEIEGYAKIGEKESWQRQWFENGNLKYERISEFGRSISERKWNEEGQLTYKYPSFNNQKNNL